MLNMNRVYERMKQYGSRMEVISIGDLAMNDAIKALKRLRQKSIFYNKETDTDEIYNDVYMQVGGRLAFLNKVAKSRNMLQECEEIYQAEKTWLLVRTIAD